MASIGSIAGGVANIAGGYLGGKKIAKGLGQQGALMQAAGQKASDMAQFKPGNGCYSFWFYYWNRRLHCIS